MKKILFLVFILLLLLFGCNKAKKAPETVVMNYFNSYQKLDKKAKKNIDYLVNNEKSLDSNQKEKYKSILENHYKNLKYKIKNKKIVKNNSIIISEIEVTNNLKVLKLSEYKKNNFKDKNGYLLIKSFNDYKIDKLKKEKSTIKYNVIFYLHIKNNKWIIDNIKQSDQQKILGIYEEI